MKVKLLNTGAEISGAEVWRLAFPMKGCLAKAADAEACARIEQELAAIREPAARQRATVQMTAAGTLPDSSEFKPKPKPAPAPAAAAAASNKPESSAPPPASDSPPAAKHEPKSKSK